MINLEDFKKDIEACKQSMDKMLNVHNDIMGMLSKEAPEKFEQIAKDTRKLREAKSITEINEIMKKYANFNNK